MRHGVYPGSFNPPTWAHLAIARAAQEQRNLISVTLMVSLQAFDKEHVTVPTLAQRIDVIEASVASIPWLRVEVTDKRLIADIAEGFDVVVLGGDKWEQLHELRFYDSPAARDDALDRLPELAIAPRTGSATVAIPPGALLAVDPDLAAVSSTLARTVDPTVMTDAARRSGFWDSAAS